ncbi:GNAT family N-acetyltransferase [Rhodobacteraceae bacterium NNCM2]|nr:GNAT family N-acetyltransferase [Coraliihabitans acroporae]
MIADLRTRPAQLPRVARWIWNYWEGQESGHDLAGVERATRDEFTSHDAPLPACFVAMLGDDPVGMACLCAEDDAAPPYDDASPWLTSVFVPEGWRGHGIARAMVDHALGAARAAGEREVFLHALDRLSLYRAAGFAEIGKVAYLGQTVTLMRAEL